MCGGDTFAGHVACKSVGERDNHWHSCDVAGVLMVVAEHERIVCMVVTRRIRRFFPTIFGYPRGMVQPTYIYIRVELVIFY